jgi:hypothetical protein
MPLDDETRKLFDDTLSKLNGICTNISNLLSQGGTVTETPLDGEKQIDILQNVYGDVSNYDRHYSITRSTLTALLVTVGLAASKDGFDHLPTLQSLGLPCNTEGFVELSFALGRNFFIPLILFFLAVVTNLHFQRMTFACRLIEHKIETLIQKLAKIKPAAEEGKDKFRDHKAISDISGFEFRHHLGTVYNKIPSPHFDLMARLLLTGISLFCCYVFVLASQECKRKLVWNAIILFGIPVLVYLAAHLWNFIREKVAGLHGSKGSAAAAAAITPSS